MISQILKFFQLTPVTVFVEHNGWAHPYVVLMGIFCLCLSVGLLCLLIQKNFSGRNVLKVTGLSMLPLMAAFMVGQSVFLYVLLVSEYADAFYHQHCFFTEDAYYWIENFAAMSKEFIPDSCSARLVTDMDISRDPGFYYFNTLAYHLYPVDIRNIRSQDPGCYIFFAKDHWKRLVPAGFTAATFDDRYGVAWRTMEGGAP